MERRHHSHRNCDCHKDNTVKMSVNYAAGLSPYPFKGKCGLPERLDDSALTNQKVEQLVNMIKSSNHMMAIVGAGISTACGIPDFRGPKGVWTLEEKGYVPESAVTFDSAIPSVTHMALVALEQSGYLKYLVSQNVDGLLMRSGFPLNRLGELHGNVFFEECDYCHAKYLCSEAVPTMALNYTGKHCTQTKRRGYCRGKLRDTILDWEDELPEKELFLSDFHARKADICLCLGTSLQIVPCGNFPKATKQKGGKVVIVNLQTTKQDRICDLRLWAYCDEVMAKVCVGLGLEIPGWDSPTIVYYSKHTGEKEKKDIKMIVDESLNVVEEAEEAEKQAKPDPTTVEKLSDSRVSLIKAVEVPGMKREHGLGDIAAAAAIAAAAVRRITEPRDPAPEPRSDEEDGDHEVSQTLVATNLATMPVGAIQSASMPTTITMQSDGTNLIQPITQLQGAQIINMTPAQLQAQLQNQAQQIQLPQIIEQQQTPQVQHVILSADGSQTQGQVLYAQGRNSEGYIVYGPTPPENQAQVYADHDIPESDQTVITQEPLSSFSGDQEDQQQVAATTVQQQPQVMTVNQVQQLPQVQQIQQTGTTAGTTQLQLPTSQASNVQQVIIEQITPQETLIEETNNVQRIVNPQQLLADQGQGAHSILNFDNQLLTAVSASNPQQPVSIAIKSEGQLGDVHVSGQAQTVTVAPSSTVRFQPQIVSVAGTRTDGHEVTLAAKGAEGITTRPVITIDANAIPAKKRKYNLEADG